MQEKSDQGSEQRIALLEMLALGRKQVEQGKVVPLDQAIKQIKARRKTIMQSNK